MAYSVKILKDSLNIAGDRLTTWELTYPRFVHAEFMTHRVFSRNSASSRAIPIEKMIERVYHDPVVPVHWGQNQKGMQAEQEIASEGQAAAATRWRLAQRQAIDNAHYLSQLGVHKQIVNRLLEPFMWITVICSGTEFGNFFNLRCHKDAQPEIRTVAEMMWRTYQPHSPTLLQPGEWHLPLTGFAADEHLSLGDLRKVSVARCARVSYLTHDGRRDVAADIALHDRLAASGHWSPFEHVAMALAGSIRSGNFTGFDQYRKTFRTENRTVFPWVGDDLR